MSDGDGAPAAVVDFLATVPLLDGIPTAELTELARVMRRRELPAGQLLWRQEEAAREMLLIVDGDVAVSLLLPGQRTVEVARLGRGELVGEVPLLDGGTHPTTARVVAPSSVLALSHAEFAALVSRNHPTSFTLKRRGAAVGCTRLRQQLAALAASLGGDDDHGPPPVGEGAGAAALEFCGPPDSGYVKRLATFHAVDPLALWGLLTAGRYARVPAGQTVVAEGERSDACYLMINGAVEKVIVRGGGRIRVGLAGPGQAFGYEGLIDGQVAPVTATTRERTLVLVLPREAFERLFHGEDAGSHAFLDVIHRDLMAAVRQALRPHARLAASV